MEASAVDPSIPRDCSPPASPWQPGVAHKAAAAAAGGSATAA